MSTFSGNAGNYVLLKQMILMHSAVLVYFYIKIHLLSLPVKLDYSS